MIQNVQNGIEDTYHDPDCRFNKLMVLMSGDRAFMLEHIPKAKTFCSNGTACSARKNT